MIKIEKNISMPTPKNGGRIKKYPWEDMKIGDSFLYTDHIDDRRKACQRIGAIAGTWVKWKKSKRKFACRSVEDGIRVFRTK